MGWFLDRDRTEDGLFSVGLAFALPMAFGLYAAVASLATGGDPLTAFGGVGGQIAGLFMFLAWIYFGLDLGRFGDAHKRNVGLGIAAYWIAVVAYGVVGMAAFAEFRFQQFAADPFQEQTTTAIPARVVWQGFAGISVARLLWFGAALAFLSRIVPRTRRRIAVVGLVVFLVSVGVAAVGVDSLTAGGEVTVSDIEAAGPLLLGSSLLESVASALIAGVALAAWWDWRGRKSPPPGAPAAGASPPEGPDRGATPSPSVDLPCPECATTVRVDPGVARETLTCPECGFRGRLPDELRG